MIIVNERDKYGETKQTRQRLLNNYAIRKDDPFSLDFLVNDGEDDFLEYGEEIMQKAEMSEKDAIADYFNNQGIVHLLDGGYNDFLQTVLQVLAEI